MFQKLCAWFVLVLLSLGVARNSQASEVRSLQVKKTTDDGNTFVLTLAFSPLLDERQVAVLAEDIEILGLPQEAIDAGHSMWGADASRVPLDIPAVMVLVETTTPGVKASHYGFAWPESFMPHSQRGVLVPYQEGASQTQTTRGVHWWGFRVSLTKNQAFAFFAPGASVLPIALASAIPIPGVNAAAAISMIYNAGRICKDTGSKGVIVDLTWAGIVKDTKRRGAKLKYGCMDNTSVTFGDAEPSTSSH